MHFDPANLEAIRVVNSGEIGEPRVFSSVFCQQVEEGNVRLKKEFGGGPLMDMGVHAINAARYLFRSEPQEVIAFGANDGEPRFREIHEMAAAILPFPGERFATLTCSFGASPIDTFQVVGTKGDLRMRVVQAILKSLRSGAAVKLDVPARPDASQKIALRPVKPPEVVHAESPAGRK